MLLESGAAENFIEVEVSTAELFASLALEARDAEARERHLGTARKAHDTARHFLTKTDLSESSRSQFTARLAEVQSKLRSA